MIAVLTWDDDRWEDAPVSTLLRRTYIRHARKARRCDDCHRTIAPGDPYVREVWIVDGDFTDLASHSPNGYPCYNDD